MERISSMVCGLLILLEHYHFLTTHDCTGKHDDFCFVCGGTMELFECQTCDNCYHAECMSPTLEPSEVPGFWFCPHCVDRELHIPPYSPITHYFTPVSLAQPFPSPTKTPGWSTMTTSHNAENNLKRPAVTSNSGEQVEKAQSQVYPDGNSNVKGSSRPAETDSTRTVPHKGITGRQRHSYSPPRKKSKY